MNDDFNSKIEAELAILYNAAWIEGSNWKENNPEAGPIPSEREVKKTAQTQARVISLIKSDVLGEDEYGNIGYDGEDMVDDTSEEMMYRNLMRHEQRAILDGGKKK